MKSIIIAIIAAVALITTGCSKKTADVKQAEQVHEATKDAITATYTARETTVEAQTEADKKAALAAEDARHAQVLADLQKSAGSTTATK